MVQGNLDTSNMANAKTLFISEPMLEAIPETNENIHEKDVETTPYSTTSQNILAASPNIWKLFPKPSLQRKLVSFNFLKCVSKCKKNIDLIHQAWDDVREGNDIPFTPYLNKNKKKEISNG